MFSEDRSGALDIFLSDYMKGDNFYGKEALGMTEETFREAINIFNDAVKNSQPKIKKDNRSIRLTKGQDCPVCNYKIQGEVSNSSGKDYVNTCAKCGLSEESSKDGTLHQLTLEEFQWAYWTEDAEDVVKERAEEEGLVLSLYRKIWSGMELSSSEDDKLEMILASQKDAIIVK